MKTKGWAILLVILCTILTSLAQVLWKLGSVKLPAIFTNWELLLGYLLYAIAAAMLITSFKGGEVSVLYPIVATSYIWVALLSWIYFDELFNSFKIIGIAALVAGIIMVGVGSKQNSAVDYLEAP